MTMPKDNVNPNEEWTQSLNVEMIPTRLGYEVRVPSKVDLVIFLADVDVMWYRGWLWPSEHKFYHMKWKLSYLIQ